MRSPQEKFFAALDRDAANEELEVVVAKSFSNVGTIYLQPADSFETLLEIPFDFQGGRLALGWMSSRDARPVFPSRSNPSFALFDPEKYGVAIEALLAAARGGV